MKKVYKYKKKLPLEQGKFYLFELYKKVNCPKGDKYFVLTDPFGNKHLVPVKYYTNYKLKMGSYYLCKVDKINCLGRIFIEPPHPFYKENESYLFQFSKTFEEKHKSGNVYPFHLFLGKNNYKAFLATKNSMVPKYLKTGTHSFLVKKISKGKVYIDT